MQKRLSTALPVRPRPRLRFGLVIAFLPFILIDPDMQRTSWLDWLKLRLSSYSARSCTRRCQNARHASIENLETRQVLTAPAVASLSNVTLLAGSPLLVSLDGSDTENQNITYTVSSSNPNIVASVLRTGRSLKMDVVGKGSMKFQLLEDYAHRATEHVATLADSGFYAGSIFHKILDGNIYSGDPTGVPPGTGGSSLGAFDDQFSLDLQHNRAGLLSATKLVEGIDDSSDSQFFITGGAHRNFDSENTIFGVLVEGESVRADIADEPTTSNRPTNDVVIDDITVVTDLQNGVLLLKTATGVSSGTATITVTATDSSGEFSQRTFQVTVATDTSDSPPFLADLPKIRTLVNTATTLQLTAIDAEGQTSAFLDQMDLQDNGTPVPVTANANLQYDVATNTGVTTITPKNGLLGLQRFSVATGLQISALDNQVATVEIVASAQPLTVSGADHPGRPQEADGLADVFEVKRNGSRIEVRINGQLSVQSELVAVSQLTLTGSSDDDTFIIDLSGGDPMPSGGVTINGDTATGSDNFRIIGGTSTTISHTYSAAAAGTITVGTKVITLSGIENVRDALTATTRNFTYPATANVLTLGDDGVAANGLSKLDADASAPDIEFKDNTGTLTINLGAGNDSLTVDVLDTGAKAVTVLGGVGNDFISAGSLNDSLLGDAGNDTILAGGGDDTVYGGADNDRLVAGAGIDLVQGDDGNDFVDGGGTSGDSVGGNLGNDTVSGGAGTNFLYEGGDAPTITLTPTGLTGLGTDTISNVTAYILRGGDGPNVIDVTAMTVGITIYGGAGNDTIRGGHANDAMLGNDGDDVMFGNDGNDNLLGGAGKDDLSGGNGNDRVDGGGSSNDSLRGGAGNDTFTGGTGADFIIESADVNWLITKTTTLTQLTGLGTDRVLETEVLQLTGGAGNNTIDVRQWTFGAVTLDGGAGNDALFGTTFNDFLNGNLGNDTITAGDGNDSLLGGAGSDSLIGGNGNDRLLGQDDSGDRLLGGVGNDTLDGGAGDDMIIETVTGSAILTNTALTGNGTDVVVGVEQASLTGSSGDDTIDASGLTAATAVVTLDGGAGNDSLRGTTGNDSILGGDGNDTLRGGAGNDTLDAGNGNDGLSGAAGNDVLTGGENDDTLFGGSGNDTVLGGNGNDTCYGGAGVDSVRGNGGSDKIAGGSGTGSQTGDQVLDVSADIAEFFVLTPIPAWVDEV